MNGRLITMNDTRSNNDRSNKKQKKRNGFSLFMGLLFGIIFAINFFYWYPLAAEKFSLPKLPQVNTGTKDSTTVTADIEKPTSESHTTESSTQETIVEEKDAFYPRMNFQASDQISTIYQPLSNKIDTMIQQNNMTGTYLVVKNNQLVLYKSYGNAHEQINDPYKSSYSIASLQKSMTAVLLVQLVEEKKISLDDHIDKFFPEIPNGQNITLNQLLSMTSGLSLTEKKPSSTKSYQDLYNFVLTHTAYKDVTKWTYSEVNYLLATMIIEKVTGQGYDEVLEEKIIKPLNLENSFVFNKRKEDQSLVKPIENNQERDIPEYAVLNEVGIGNWAFTASDFLIFIQALLDGKLLNQESLNLLWSYPPALYNYSYKSGFYHYPTSNRGHGLFRSYEPTVHFSNSGDTAVLFFANTYQPNDLNAALTKQIFETVVADPAGL